VWVLAGCSTVVVLTAAGVGYGIYSFVQGVKHGSITCLPSDFPRYPGAVYARFSYDLNGAYPGNTCDAVFESNDDVAAVTAFYQSKLNTGAWQVTSSGNQAGTVIFQPAKSATPFGAVQVAVSNTHQPGFSNAHTEITIDLYTSTCLPLGFPMYPEAKFGGQNIDRTATKRFCHIVFVSNHSVAAVTAFYKRELNTGNWQVTSSGTGQVGWRLWRLTRGPFGARFQKITVVSGTVAIAISGERTEITVDSS
jgi:hypothetical protein